MKQRSTRNQKQSSARAQRKKYVIKGVVKRGTDPAWQQTKKIGWKTCKALFLLAIFAGLYLAGREGYRRFFWENPDYALKEIKVVTDGSITREQALELTGLVTKRNIFSYDITAVGDALRKLPQVDRVEVLRYLPSRIEVNITERKPIAWVTGKGADPAKFEKAYLLDARGSVFKPKRLLAEYDSLPVILGAELQDIELGKLVRQAEFISSLALLKHAQAHDGFKVLSIDLSKGYCLKVTNHNHTELTFGLDHIETQFARFAALERETALLGQTMKTANLMLVRNVPVTFVPDEDAEPEPEPVVPVKDAPKAKVIGSDTPAKPSTKDKTPAKKAEPSKPKTTPKREGDRLLKPFRTA